MLPDYPATKAKIDKLFHERLRHAQLHFLGVFSDAPSHRVFEGHKTLMIRSDGTTAENEYQEISVIEYFDTAELENLTWEEICKKLDSVAARMAADQVKIM